MNELMSYFKLLKCEYMMIKGNTVYGVDKDFAHLASTSLKHSELLEFESIPFKLENKELIQYKDSFITSKFDYIINMVSEYTCYDVSMMISELNENEKFKEILNKKAKMGISYLTLEGYLLMINKSLVPVNKNDKVDVIIRDVDRFRFLCQFVIKKGKNELNKFFMYLRLN